MSSWPAHADDARDAVACRDLLASPKTSEPGLDATDIHLVNWNMHKGAHALAATDLNRLGGNSDLVLLQESTLERDFLRLFGGARYWSFAPGYQSGEHLTGVMTLSAAMPLARCSLTIQEPWLGTPKATSITQYALEGSDDTLIVVNVHAINFTLGTRQFAAQFDAIGSAIHGHIGPVILSGDFNTWRPQRRRVVDRIVGQLGLSPVRFGNDQRKRVFGLALDHVYVRGLEPVESSTRVVDSSDHNPMSVRFARAPIAAQ